MKYTLLPALSQDEIHRLYNPLTDESIKTLVNHNQGLIRIVAKKYHSQFLSFDDICQDGNVGLLRAIRKYEPSKSAFSTYAYWWIRAEISRGVSMSLSSAHFPANKANALRNEIPSELSLDALTDIEDAYSKSKLLAQNAQTVQNLEAQDNIRLLNKYICLLPTREIDILKMQFGLCPYTDEHTYQRIGDKYNLSRERIRQISNSAVKRLKNLMITISDEFTYS